MGKKHIESYVVGNIETNCYLFIDDESMETLIIDPGGEAEMLGAEIVKKGLKPLAILLTHSHYDHISGAGYLHDRFNIPRIISQTGQKTMSDPDINMSPYIGGSPEKYQAEEFMSDMEEKTIGSFTFRSLETPGHTPCGMCFYFQKEMVLFSGDTLFAGSVGRTDFPGGSMSTLIRAVRERIMTLPETVKVYPGHGPDTTVGEEKEYNPYFGFM